MRHARVRLFGPTSGATATDGFGQYRFDNLRPGQYRLVVDKPGFVAPDNASAQDVEVSAAPLTTVDVELLRGAAIDGRLSVTDPSARAVDGRDVTIERLSAAGDVEQSVIQRTDDRGYFRFHTLPPGRYRLRTFVYTPAARFWFYPGTTDARLAPVIALAAGQTFTAASFPIPPDISTSGAPMATGNAAAPAGGAIEGRVFDDYGEPAPWIRVQLLQRTFLAGRYRLYPEGHVGGTLNEGVAEQTDDLGRFRFTDVTPGDHYVMALSTPFGRTPQGPAAADGMTGVAPTFFPGTDRSSEARAVHVDAGETVDGLTISLLPAATGSLAIKGLALTTRRQVNMGDAARFARMLRSLDMLFPMQRGDLEPALGVSVDGERDFATALEPVIRNLPAGDYALWSGNQLIPVSVAAGIVNEVTNDPRPRPPVAVRGHVVFEGPRARPRPEQVDLGVETTDIGRILVMGAASRHPLPVNNRWMFESSPWSPASGVIRASTPEGWTLARVTTSGRDITDFPFDFTGTEDLEVVLTSNVGRVTGTVAAGESPTDAHGVVVFAESPLLWRYPSRFIRIGHANGLGNFAVDGLLPGRYLVLALPDNEHDEVDLDWLAAARGAAMQVEVAEGAETRLVVPAPR